ncbi:helix-turn-helix transcriptional regulator [Desulfoscipio sp. XC116]|uniref:helix-turn-helix transcriptional regulator n=1 Tax=Desulfoscipio sp. XC116 TaxID=3144975 RepID=UPI00325B981F
MENNGEINNFLNKFFQLVGNENQCDSVIFRNAINIANAIVGTFGKYCEVVIHDLRTPESSIIYMAGNVTNRKVGAPITNFVLENLRKYGNSCKDSIGYKSVTKDGNILKSSTIYIKNATDKIIGTVCINYDITALINHLEEITKFDDSNDQEEINEFFATDVTEILDIIINQAIIAKGIPMEEMKKEDKIEIVGALDVKGVFLIKGAVDKLALALGVSRYTIYNYLEQERSQRNAIY